MRGSDLYLCGSELALPEQRMTLDQARAAGYLISHDETLGNPSVPILESGPPAADLAVNALRRTLEDTELDPLDSSWLLHGSWWHQGYDTWSAAHYIAHQTDALAATPVNISQGCNAPMAAIEMGIALLRAQPDAQSIALTASDAMRLPQIDRWNMNYGCVHGDVGTSALLTRKPMGSHPFHILSVASFAAPELEEMNRSGYDATPGPVMTLSGQVDLRQAKRNYLQEHGGDDFRRLSSQALLKSVYLALQDADISARDTRVKSIVVPRLSEKIFDSVYRAHLDPLFGEKLLLWWGSNTGHLGVGDVGANIVDAIPLLNSGEILVVVNAGGGYTWSTLILEAKW